MFKVGIHCISPTAQALSIARKSPCVLALDDPKPLYAAPAGALRLFRRYFPTQDVRRRGWSVVNEVLGALGNAPCDAILLYVEEGQHVGAGLEEHLLMIREAVTYLAAIRPGMGVVGLNWSTGAFEKADVEYCARNGWGGMQYVGLHAYFGPQGPTQWHGYRHRLLHQWSGGKHPPIIITECGADAVDTEGAAGKPGWRRQGYSREEYVARLRAYDIEIARDDYVKGAVVFTAGATDRWRDFDIDELADIWPAWEKPAAKEEHMPLSIAIVPSNQDRNTAPLGFPPPLNEYTEAGGMRILADKVLAACKQHGIPAAVCWSDFESHDTTHLSNLKVAIGKANAWLGKQPKGNLKVTLHLHTDASGPGQPAASHTAYIIADGASKAIGLAVAGRVQQVLGTKKLMELSMADLLAFTMARDCFVCYLEVCAHDYKPDLEKLYGLVDSVASAIVDGLASWADSVQPPPPGEPDWKAEAAGWKAKAMEYKRRLEEAKAYVAKV